MTNLLQPHVSSKEGDRRAQEWLDNLDHRAAVGTRHHIVPRFLLERFASANDQLRVRNRTDGRASLRSIGDLAVRDFYTVVTSNSELDSSVESFLSIVEGGAAQTLRQHLDYRAFARPRAFTAQERSILDEFVATQAIRGMRMRRAIEVTTDYAVKLLNQDKITDDDVRNTEFIPHPNDHLRIFGPLLERATDVLRNRSASLVHLDAPLLIIGDEPVILEREEEEAAGRGTHAPDMTTAQDLVLIEGGLGFANAEVILLPISPSTLLVYGPPGRHNLPAVVEFSGEEARSTAEELNLKIADAAIDWVAAHPDHAGFASMKMPPRQSILKVHDYGSLAAQQTNSTPARRPVRRLRPEDVLDILTAEDDISFDTPTAP